MSVTYRSNDSQAGAIPVDTKVKTTNTADGQVQHVNVDSIVEMPSLDHLIEARTQTPTKSDALNVQIGPGDPISNIPIVMDFQHHQIHGRDLTGVQPAGFARHEHGQVRL